MERKIKAYREFNCLLKNILFLILECCVFLKLKPLKISFLFTKKTNCFSMTLSLLKNNDKYLTKENLKNDEIKKIINKEFNFIYFFIFQENTTVEFVFFKNYY